tara:strand:- start:14400 stop:14915 length:516 start_codon:yes stop_codon:yes gene_type:complete
MRAQRLKRLLVKGWLMSSGGGSEQAGKNGGMEDTCGRCLYYDEIMKEYAADNSPRLEHLKQISWDQQAQHNRTIQVKLGNGSEMYKTSLINTIHVRNSHSNTQTSRSADVADVCLVVPAVRDALDLHQLRAVRHQGRPGAERRPHAAHRPLDLALRPRGQVDRRGLQRGGL